jgi:7-cyano-7-deazaguanine synthase
MALARGWRCHALSIDYGQRHRSELAAAARVVRSLGATDHRIVREVTGSDAIFTGANAVDYSGYPDCRPEYMEAFGRLANLATRRAVEGQPITIECPIISLRKDEIVRQGFELGVDFALTVSCYDADAAGRACGACEACRLRRAGFERAGIEDPTRYAPG